MKLQDLLLPACLAFLTVWAINFFFPHRTDTPEGEVRSGQSFQAIPVAQMCQPKNTEIDFFDGIQVGEPVETTVKGYDSQWIFSSNGGSLARLDFERDLGGKPGTIATVIAPDENNREDDAFLVALNDSTPYFFKFVDKKVEDKATYITYVSETPAVRMTKRYVVSHDTYKVDLILTVEPLGKDVAVQPRVFFPAPYMFEIAERDRISGVVYSPNGKISKIKPEKIGDTVWAAPQIFGAEDLYFVNALVADENKFTQRAYFRLQDRTKLTAILEGPSVDTKTEWTMSFYCGPKESASLTAVDKRLDAVLDFGWFAWFAQLMLYLLNLIYSFTHNYGWAIVILTLLMRLVMLPFVKNPQQNLNKKKEMDRKMKHLEQKYKDDREALARAKMDLMRQSGMFSGLGCLPLLLQFPFFLGLNYALRNCIQLYDAPFILWIKDLSASDPYYVLPVIIAVGFFFTIAAQMKDPRQKVAAFIGSVFIGGLMANLSAGLGLFICTSTLLGAGQNWLMKKWKK